MIEKFTFDITSPRFQGKLILVKALSENRGHVVMKLLSYLLFYQPGLKVEVSASMHYKPDLLALDDDGAPALWIDCGKVAIKKVENLSAKLRKTRLILVKETKNELEQFRKVVDKKVEHAERLEFLAFEKGFIGSVAEALQKVNQMTLYDVTERVIGVALNDQIFESELYS